MINKLTNKLSKEFLTRNNGQKRKFVLAGIINALLTNITLQALLLFNFIPILISTLISQFINMTIGYLIYGKFIFKIKQYKKITFIARYTILMLIIWLLNFIVIEAGFNLGISSNLIAFLMIPMLAIVSFIFQKYWVFK
tara:strand:+ start:1084 stop:1500 length:417 start_codon:yes stop_codon:yes gene_type:complete